MKLLSILKALPFSAQAGLLGLALVSFAADAHATTKSNCSVTWVQYDAGRLAVQCSGDASIYYAFTSGGSCTSVSSTVLGVWTSMFQAALLAGRSIDFEWATPSGCANRTIEWGVKLK